MIFILEQKNKLKYITYSYQLAKMVCNLFAQRKFFKSFLEKDTLGNRHDAKNWQQKGQNLAPADTTRRSTHPKSSYITQRLKSEVGFGCLD